MLFFTTYIYQPFFNILVGIYWVISQISVDFADMGVAVIIFSLIIRFLMLPLTLAGERSAEEKRKIVEEVKKIEAEQSHDPVIRKNLIRQTLRKNRRIVFSTIANLIIQLVIILMLYRIFTTGLTGEDFHLLYDFMPNIQDVNLVFLGKYDLTHTSATLNLLQSAMIFIVELLLAIRSPFPIGKRDIALMQVILPLGSYVIFMFLPAGKKLFIIASLAFSAGYSVVKILQEWATKISEKLQPKVVVEEEEKEE